MEGFTFTEVAQMCVSLRFGTVLLLLLASFSLFSGGCDSFEGERIFTWNDSDSGARVEVRAQMYGGKSRVYMQVTRDGLQKRMVLASGAQIRDASLVLYNDFVLVLAGPYVIGGYQVSADKILPMNAPALPFTVRSGSGFVLDEVHLADGDNVPPPNFIERPDRR